MPKLVERGPAVILVDQFADDGGPVILFNTFAVPPEDADRLLAA